MDNPRHAEFQAALLKLEAAINDVRAYAPLPPKIMVRHLDPETSKLINLIGDLVQVRDRCTGRINVRR